MGFNKKVFVLMVALIAVALLATACNTGGGGKLGVNGAKVSGAGGQANAATQSGKPSAKVVSVTSPASPGSLVTLFAKATPGATCEIKVGYKTGENEAEALKPKRAEENGFVSWSWTIDPEAAYGSYPISITAKTPGGQSAKAADVIDIKSPEECKK